MQPSLTVLMPVRDAATTLVECLRSILAQSLRDFELLIVDDHSTDDSVRIAKAMAADDSRIRIVANSGKGIVAALNTGLAEARADTVARMDADDLMHPDRLTLQLDCLNDNPDTILISSCVSQFPELTDGYREYLNWQNQCRTTTDIRDEIFVESPFAHPSVTFRRQIVVDAGGYRHGDFPEDYELWLRLNDLGFAMAKLPQVLLQWRDSPQRLSRQDPRCRREAFDRLRAKYLARDARLRGAAHFAIWGAGRRTRQRCAALLSQGFKPAAWIDIDPLKIGNRLDGVPVVSPDWLLENRMLVLGYVANHGAREDIAGWLESHNFNRGRDYLMVG
ncbi:MAG: glycosyltransferase [Gammaproteobacteria bacterium]|nr:glycosyltransferase [Gammaproteobacteria bacterium]